MYTQIHITNTGEIGNTYSISLWKAVVSRVLEVSWLSHMQIIKSLLYEKVICH
jgi:hypothetical protein